MFSNKMSNKKIFWNRKAMAPTSILSAFGVVAAVFLLLFVILPVVGGWLGLTVGGTAQAANSIDGGFARLIRQIETLEEGKEAPVALTVDEDFWLVSFNKGEAKVGNAISSPECGGRTCVCVCIDDTCGKIDIDRNRGRDCRALFDYDAIKVNGVAGNSGGDHFYVKGEKTISVMLKKSGTTIEAKQA